MIPLNNYDVTKRNIKRETLDEIYFVHKIDGKIFPITY